jgi:pimeloyl-ACP methyl ester carboxylesterase
MSASYLDPLVQVLTGPFSPILYQQRGLPPTTVGEPFTVETHVADAAAVIDEAVGGRAWIVGHSWGGYLALHVLVTCPERLAGAIIIDPLGAHVEVMAEFGERMEAPLADAAGAGAEIEVKEGGRHGDVEESMEASACLAVALRRSATLHERDYPAGRAGVAATMSVREPTRRASSADRPPCLPVSLSSSCTAPRA